MLLQHAPAAALRQIADDLEREAGQARKRAQSANRSARRRARIAVVVLEIAQLLEHETEDDACRLIADKHGKRLSQIAALLPLARRKLDQVQIAVRNRRIYQRALAGALNTDIAAEFDLSAVHVGRIVKDQFFRNS